MYLCSFRRPPGWDLSETLISEGTEVAWFSGDFEHPSMQGWTVRLVSETHPLDSTSLHVSHASADDRFDADERFVKRDCLQNLAELEGGGVCR